MQIPRLCFLKGFLEGFFGWILDYFIRRLESPRLGFCFLEYLSVVSESPRNTDFRGFDEGCAEVHVGIRELSVIIIQGLERRAA